MSRYDLVAEDAEFKMRFSKKKKPAPPINQLPNEARIIVKRLQETVAEGRREIHELRDQGVLLPEHAEIALELIRNLAK